MKLQLKIGKGNPEAAALERTITEKATRFETVTPETAYLEVEITMRRRAVAGGRCDAKALLDIPGEQSVIRFTAKGETCMEAVDAVFDKLDRELSRLKERRVEHRT